MIGESKLYSFNSRIRYSEIDLNNKLSIGALVNYFQDCSTFHSEEIDEGFLKLKSINRVWVLSNWQIVINKLPSLGDEVVIGTWPYDFKGFFGFRNFIMKDMDNNILAIANSVWVYMNTVNNRPVRFDLDDTSYVLSPKSTDFKYCDRKIDLPVNYIEEEKIHVTKSLLDTNNHVNNSQYIKLALDYLPATFKIKEIRAEYKKSALLNHLIVPKLTCYENKVVVNLTNEHGHTYAIIEFIN